MSGWFCSDSVCVFATLEQHSAQSSRRVCFVDKYHFNLNFAFDFRAHNSAHAAAAATHTHFIESIRRSKPPPQQPSLCNFGVVLLLLLLLLCWRAKDTKIPMHCPLPKARPLVVRCACHSIARSRNSRGVHSRTSPAAE